MVKETARRSTPDDVTGADEQRPSYVIDSANTTLATPLPPRKQMARNRARPDRGGPMSTQLALPDAMGRRPYRWRGFPAVTFQP